MALKARTKNNVLELTKQVAEMGDLIDELQAKVTALVTLTTELKTDLSEHTHDGVTAGAGTTAAGPTIAAATVTV